MASNNEIYKNYKDSSLLITINRRWRWVLGNYAYGHDLEEVLAVDELFKRYPSVEEKRSFDEYKENNMLSLKQCIKRILKFFYTPFRYGMNYRMRQQLWDLDGHLKDSKYDILNHINDSKYDILNHIRDSEIRLKQHSYLISEQSNNIDDSLKRIEQQFEANKGLIY